MINTGLTPPILEVENLSVTIKPKHAQKIKIIDQISFSINAGERVAIVGESGSGKSVTAMTIMNLIENAEHQGQIKFKGNDLLIKSEHEFRAIRGNQIAITFQDSLSTLNPIMKIGDQITEVLTIRGVKKSQAKAKALDLLSELGFDNPPAAFVKFPHQFSGGMRQRVMIAIALVADPEILIADEPTTALDVRIQAQVLGLIDKMAMKKNLTIIFISHDMGVVAGFADRVIVMYAGRILEQGTVEEIFYQSRHPYTRALLNSIPTINRDPSTPLPTIKGTTPEPNSRPVGCVFQDRCDRVQDKCQIESPKLMEASKTHQYACFFPVLTNMESSNAS